jgi:hypothetical protein
VSQAERYARNGALEVSLVSRGLAMVNGSCLQSSKSNRLCSGSVGCVSPWPAKWNTLAQAGVPVSEVKLSRMGTSLAPLSLYFRREWSAYARLLA